jgi:glycosyltransferase involved in cell wall biosynthesis
MSSSRIQLSVALVTRDRSDSLERTLASLRLQSVQPFEIIVSDDSGRDQAKRIRDLVAEYGGAYYMGPRRGLYANRNFAAKQCHGSHIRTMDDDHILQTDHLARCIDAVRCDPGSIWTVGESCYLNGEAFLISETGIQLGPAGVGVLIKDPDDHWGIADGSTIYPREVFDHGLWMEEEFGFGSSYLEFGAYLHRNGWRCRCVPGVLVEHYAAALSQPDPVSIVFASVCFNLYFRPNPIRLIRYLAPHGRELRTLPHLFKKAKRRWGLSTAKISQLASPDGKIS